MNGFRKFLLVVAGSAGFAFSPHAGASTIYTSTNGAAGSQQIWIKASDFDSRSASGDNGAGNPDFVAQGAATGALGGSAYYFNNLAGQTTGPSVAGGPSPVSTSANPQKDWWAQYSIPIASLPAAFQSSINGSNFWAFWSRTSVMPVDVNGNPDGSISYTNSPHTGQQSNFLIHQGPNEAAAAATLNSANPTSADWLAAATGGTTANDRIEKNIDNNGGLQPNWIWMSGDGTPVITASGAVRKKALTVYNGVVTFRIFERQPGPENALSDVLMFSLDPGFTTSGTNAVYVPNDADGTAAITPEPASLGVLVCGLAVCMRSRRRTSVLSV